jgi:hypothetical protein
VLTVSIARHALHDVVSVTPLIAGWAPGQGIDHHIGSVAEHAPTSAPNPWSYLEVQLIIGTVLAYPKLRDSVGSHIITQAGS